MELRPYQQRAVDFLRSRERAFIIAPAGSGKTIMAAVAMADAFQRDCGEFVKPKGLWLANTIDQCGQAVEALGAVGGRGDADIEVCCAASAPDASGVDCLVIDEAHHAMAQSWRDIIEQAPRRVFGFSATPFLEDPERDAELVAFFGGMDNFFRIGREEVLQGGHLVKARVVFHDLDERNQFDELINERAAPEIIERCWKFRGLWGRQYGERIPSTKMERNGVVFEIAIQAKIDNERYVRFAETKKVVRENRVRNAHAVLTARAGVGAGRSVLVLVSSIEHGTELQTLIPDSVLVYSKIGAKKRRAAIADFKSGAVKCLIATSLAEEGLDVPIASEAIILGGGRSSRASEQKTGRVLRPFAGKDEGVIHDYLDRGAVMAHAQAKAREKTYRGLNYTVEHSRS